MSASGAQISHGPRLTAGFFERQVTEVARDLLGCSLLNAGVGGVIVETEAYHESEPACHAYGRRTARNARLFGPAGVAYVYLSYGIHSLFNVVTGPAGEGAAVLIRALEPSHGERCMRERRGGRTGAELCSGPGRLTQALGIELDHDGVGLEQGPLELRDRPAGVQRPELLAGRRIGITKATELRWRFSVASSRHVSRPRPAGR